MIDLLLVPDGVFDGESTRAGLAVGIMGTGSPTWDRGRCRTGVRDRHEDAWGHDHAGPRVCC